MGEEIEKELEAFPSHFRLDGIDTLSMPKMHSMIGRINDSKQLDLQHKPWYHEVSRDRNILLFLEYKTCEPRDTYSVIEKIKKTTVEYPKDMIALANLAWIYINTDDVDEAEVCLDRLKLLGVWSRVCGDAELAYAYSRMGPRFFMKGKDLFLKVISYRQYAGIQNEERPKFLRRLLVIWHYGAALANQRILNPTVFGDYRKDFNCGRNGDPERILKENCDLLESVVSSPLGHFVAKAWLVLRQTYLDYIQIRPKKLRYMLLERMIGVTPDHCLENAIQATRTVSRDDHYALFMIGKTYRKVPLKDINKAKTFLLKAEKFLKHPGTYHHLALVCVDKWLLKFTDRPNRGGTENIRDPGNPLLLEAIGYLEKAIECSQQVGVQFLTDLARYKFSCAPEPFTKESKDDILATLNQSLVSIRKYSETTLSDQAYAYLQLGLIHEAFGDLKKRRTYFKRSVEKAVSCGRKAMSFPMLMDIVKQECEENPGITAYKEQAELYEMVHQHSEAIASYQKICECGDNSPGVLEKLAQNFCHVSQYIDARQCLRSLLSAEGSQYLSDDENKKRFIDVCLKVGQQFIEDNMKEEAVDIYHDLIADFIPSIVPAPFSKIVVLSSENKDDNPRTESLVNLFRCDLGFDKKGSCVWPYEFQGISAYGGRYEDFIVSYVKKTWCCVVHLTDELSQDQPFMSSTAGTLRNVANLLMRQPFKGLLMIIDDLTDSVQVDEKQSMLEPYQRWPILKYSDIFGDGISVATSCEKMVKGLLQYKEDSSVQV